MELYPISNCMECMYSTVDYNNRGTTTYCIIVPVVHFIPFVVISRNSTSQLRNYSFGI